MKLNFRGCLAMLLTLVLCLMMGAAACAEETVPSATVNVTVALKGSPLPKPAENYTIELKSVDGAPMPADAVDGVSSITIAGAGSATLPTLTFERVGIYEYTISQKAGTTAKCTYDDSVYHLTVYVTNSESGDSLEVTAVMYKNDETDKVEVAAFTNVYPTVTPAPTGDITATGVVDSWPMYLAGALVLLVIAGVLTATLLRKDHGEQKNK